MGIFSGMNSYKSIIVLLGTIMLLSCKNDIKKVNALTDRKTLPEMSGENMEMIYSDSARIKYKAYTPLYNKIHTGEEEYDEFPQGIHVISYDKDGKVVGEVKSKYAKNLIKEKLWEVRNQVVVMNAEGKRLETEVLYWDMEKEWIYSDRYSRLIDGNNILESSGGFESDQNLKNPVFKNITDGEVQFEMKPNN